MRVNGEAYFLLNFWVDLMALLLGGRFTHVRFRPVRGLLSAVLGGLYALLAWCGAVMLRSPPVWLAVLALCCVMAYGALGLRALPGVAAAGLFFSGCAELWLRYRLPGFAFFPATGVAVLLLCGLPRQEIPPGQALRLVIRHAGRTLDLPVLRDSGNALRDPLTGLPVIVVSAQAARRLLPAGVDTDDLSTLPRGFRLIRVDTAVGGKTLMCFHPGYLALRTGRGERETDAIVAFSAFREKSAVVPEILIQQEVKRHAAIIGNAEMDASVFCAAGKRKAALYRRGGSASAAVDPAGRNGAGRPPARG